MGSYGWKIKYPEIKEKNANEQSKISERIEQSSPIEMYPNSFSESINASLGPSRKSCLSKETDLLIPPYA